MQIEIIALAIATTFVFCFGTPVPPTTRRPETPVFEDGENEHPFFRESDHPIDEQTWALWNQNPNRNCPWWEQHRPGGEYDFPDYPSPLHVQWHFARCKLKHPSYSGSGQSSRSGSSSSNSIEEVLDPIDILSRSSSSSVEELPARPGDFQDTYIRHPQEPDFLQNPPTGNEIIFVDESPEIIEIFIEDQEPSTSTGRRSGQGPPTGRPQACLKRQSEVQEPGSSQKKPKTKNIAGGCEIIYIDSGRETPEDVHLVCTSNTGEQQTLAKYQAVECSSKNNNENDIETPQTTEMPRDFEHNPEDDDHDPSQRRTNIAQFNDKLTLALLRATQGTFHQCAQLVQLQNNTARRQKRFIWIFGPAIALVIAAIAIEHEASKVPQCPNGYIQYASHCIKEGQSETCPRGFVDLRFVKKLSK